MTIQHQDIHTAALLKEKYYDLFIKNMIHRDHYIKRNNKCKDKRECYRI